MMELSRLFPGNPNNGISLWYLGIRVGMVWGTYHKRVPLLGVPENPTEVKKIRGISIQQKLPCFFTAHVQKIEILHRFQLGG